MSLLDDVVSAFGYVRPCWVDEGVFCTFVTMSLEKTSVCVVGSDVAWLG